MKNLLGLSFCLLSACATRERVAEPVVQEPASLDEVLKGAWRTDDERARDVWRHPVETLAFFGMKNDDKVVEVWPGGGWYTAVLAPYLRDKGELTVAGFPTTDKSFRGKFAKKLDERLQATPAVYDRVKTAVLFQPTAEMDVGDGTADMVVTFRNTHNKIRWEGHEPQPYFDAMARALRPGGVLGFVQHRAPEHSSEGESGKIGYLKESLIIRLAENAGLILEEKTELNANPKDTADYPDGVWTLPPGLRLMDLDRDKYVAIGESDRMTMRFRKVDIAPVHYVGETTAFSPDGLNPYGPPAKAFALRVARSEDGILTETVLDRGKLRTVTLRRTGSRFQGTDDAASFTGALDFAGHEAELDGWTYELKMADGSGTLSGSGKIVDGVITTEKVFSGPDGKAQVLIRERLVTTEAADFWSQLAEATQAPPRE